MVRFKVSRKEENFHAQVMVLIPRTEIPQQNKENSFFSYFVDCFLVDKLIYNKQNAIKTNKTHPVLEKNVITLKNDLILICYR